MAQSTHLVWLRNDLRLADNPALYHASRADHVVALYVHETDGKVRAPGAAARWWLHHSLTALNQALAEHGISLQVETGHAAEIVPSVAKTLGAETVLWNHRYAPAECAIDEDVAQALERDGRRIETFAANLLIEPGELQTGAGRPYAVFTPFWNALKRLDLTTPLRRPDHRKAISAPEIDGDYRAPAWSGKFEKHWRIGEAAARATLGAFLDEKLDDYAEGRDVPAQSATSLMSPHLRFGEISARQIWHAGRALADRDPDKAGAVDAFLREVAWRDFNYHQLYHRKDIARHAMHEKYDAMAWRTSKPDLSAWQRGLTGLPMVDAGMRELWATGFMQNRVRMLTASLLTKNLLIDWRQGEQWFWDCLVDGDVANNPGNWQWVAGSGLDASPFFRIFNPVTQGDKFDADGAYVRQWVPELAKLPDAFIQKPFAAPADILNQAGVTLGKTYPLPIVDLKLSRERALEAARAL